MFLSRLFMLLGVFLLSQAVFSFLGVAVCMRLFDLSYSDVLNLISTPRLSAEGVYTQRWVQSFYNIGSFLISAIVFAGFYRKPIPETLGLSSPAPLKQLLFVLAIAFTAIPVVSGLSAFNLKLPGIDQWADLNKLQASRDAMLQILLHSYSWLDSLLLVLTLALVPAVSEEVFFRGLLQRFFSSWSFNKHIGIGVSAMLFTLLHFSVTQFVPILFMGLLLGYIYSWTGNLWVCILVHFLNNATTVIFHRLSAQYQSVRMFQDDYQPSALVFWLAAALLFGILFWLHKKANRTATIESVWP